MEVYSSSSSCKSISEDLNSIDSLVYSLSESLHIVNTKDSYIMQDGDVDDNHDITFDHTSLSKGAKFPYDASNKEENDELSNENLKRVLDMNATCTSSVSLPTRSELVSAMKGGREKKGTPTKKMTVSWAADVYDPTPTIMSHTVRGKNKQKQYSYKTDKGNKKKGKGKEKSNKASRGSSSSKDKKHYRRITSVSDDNWYKLIDDREISSVGSLDDRASQGYDVGKKDLYCGGSFLMQSLTKVHMSVAEAL